MEKFDREKVTRVVIWKNSKKGEYGEGDKRERKKVRRKVRSWKNFKNCTVHVTCTNFVGREKRKAGREREIRS